MNLSQFFMVIGLKKNIIIMHLETVIIILLQKVNLETLGFRLDTDSSKIEQCYEYKDGRVYNLVSK